MPIVFFSKKGTMEEEIRDVRLRIEIDSRFGKNQKKWKKS